MSGAPAWVSVVALIVSALSLFVAGLSYLAGGPRLRATAFRRLQMDGSLSPTAQVTVINVGRGSTTVEYIHVLQHRGRYALTMVPDDLDGPPLSCEVGAHSTQVWRLDLMGAARAFDDLIRSGRVQPSSSHPSKFYFAVVAGNGKTHRARRAFDARALIAEDDRS